MKSCSYCHRTFHKTEHLLRHERSHTGEKPYRCDTCGRGYARSDVLLRHVRYFHPNVSSQTQRRSSDTSTNYKGRHRRHSLPLDSIIVHSGLQREPELGLEAETDHHDAAQQEIDSPISVGTHSSSTVQQVGALDLGALAAVSMLQALHEETAESTNPTGFVTKETSDTGGQPVNHHPTLFHRHEEASPFSFAHDIGETALETATPSLLTANAEFLAPEMSLGEGLAGLQREPGSLTNSKTYFNDTLQYTEAVDLLQPNLSTLDFLDFNNLSGSTPITVRGTQISDTDPVSSIPLERFARVAAIWPRNKPHETSQIASQVWADIVEYRGDNICTNTSISESSPKPTIGIENESRWGMDEEKRQELIREFGSMDSTNTVSGSSAGFLPLRLLNLGLTIAFRQPHSLVPFIHQPTFSAKSASNSIVFPLCLLGLILLDSPHVKPFTLYYLPATTKRCCSQLATHSFDSEGSERLIERLVSATLLLMAWSTSSSHCAREPFLPRMLYHQLINLAQMSGLLMPRPAASSMKNLLQQARSMRTCEDPTQIDDWAWKSWARTESFKRLIATLIMFDAWWASKLNAEPLIRTSVLLFEVPASIDLFRSSSAKSWRGLQDSGASTSAEPVEIRKHATSISMTASQDTSPIGMTGLLSAVWILILQHQKERESKSRLSIDVNRYTKETAQLSGSMLASDECGNSMLRILGDIYTRCSRFLRYRNPNCIALWHFLNLNLLANIEIFELASGRDGVESAYAALHEIANWSQTWYARRACLHASGIYVAMSRRRANDGIMLHSDMSLFIAALVLGLHVFMMRPNEPQGDVEAEPFELLEEMDWVSLGNPAAVDSLSSIDNVNGRWNDPASRFVQNGGVISFSGTVCEGGYNAAKMILLEFASLLEEVGKWNAKELSHILRIMSDSLVEVDDRLGCE